MYEVGSAFLGEATRRLAQRSGVGTRLVMEFAEIDMDRAVLDFAPATLHVMLSPSYLNEERFGLYILNYLQSVVPYLLRLLDAFPDTRGCTNLWLDDCSRGPGLGFTEGTVADQFAIPDPIFVQSNGYATIRALHSGCWIPWKDRSPVVFWRGATTGRRWHRPDWRDLPRLRLCRAAAEARDPDLFDVGLSQIVQTSSAQETEAIRATGYLKGRVPQDAFLRYRHSIDIDGNSNSWPGLFTKLLMQNAVLKVASEDGYRQWYYPKLVPWTHFIPVDAGLETLEECAVWARRNPDKALALADNAFAFAQALTVEASLREVGPRLRAYLARTDRQAPAVPGRHAAAAGEATPPFNARSNAVDTTAKPLAPAVEETSIKARGNAAASLHAAAIAAALTSAMAMQSKLPEEVLQMRGMSGRMYRRFINNLLAELPDARYLEVGSWPGSTVSAAMYGNRARVCCIDNWSEVDGQKEEFFRATDLCWSEEIKFEVKELDFRKIDYGAIGRFNVYLFDGPDGYQDRYDGITLVQAALDREFVLIVDDWNWPDVRRGAIDAIRALDMTIQYSAEIRTTQDGSHPTRSLMQDSAWHNGYFIGAVRMR